MEYRMTQQDTFISGIWRRASGSAELDVIGGGERHLAMH
jgi:hypothetical protein